MGIINGIFDTDLSGWEIEGSVNWSSGKAFMNINIPNPCTSALRQTFLITNTTISFEYGGISQWRADCYYQGSYNWGRVTIGWSLIAHVPTIDPNTGQTIITDVTLYNEDLPGTGGTIIKDVSEYIGKEATIRFYLSTAQFCSCGCCAANTWIDNVINSPNWGTLRVSSIPGKANIYVDNSFLNITPETSSIYLTDISPGSHTVKITKTDYYDYSVTVDVYPGRIYEIIAALNPKVGCINILSDPTGAKIFLSDRNGQTLNDTGFTTFKQICNLFFGDYKWKLTLPRYEPKNGIANLTSIAGAVISETLSLIGIGCIYFDTYPSGAKIIVDNVDTGLITPNKICNLVLGEHTYRLELSGYKIESGSVILTSTQGEIVSTDLRPNIIATIITPSKTTCIEPCDLTVDITWTNTGGITGIFTPTITVNGVPNVFPDEPLGPGLSVIKTFSLTGLITGHYSICPEPN